MNEKEKVLTFKQKEELMDLISSYGNSNFELGLNISCNSSEHKECCQKSTADDLVKILNYLSDIVDYKKGV